MGKTLRSMIRTILLNVLRSKKRKLPWLLRETLLEILSLAYNSPQLQTIKLRTLMKLTMTSGDEIKLTFLEITSVFLAALRLYRQERDIYLS
jgi:hypothetical protein